LGQKGRGFIGEKEWIKIGDIINDVRAASSSLAEVIPVTIMSEYLYLIHPYRHGFFDAPTGEEEAIMDEHYEYLKRGAQEGTVVLAGPCTDETFGLVVFKAENDQSANAFMFADPSVMKNIMVAELHPLRISIRGK
jgi:uncharacterized protein YciI